MFDKRIGRLSTLMLALAAFACDSTTPADVAQPLNMSFLDGNPYASVKPSSTVDYVSVFLRYTAAAPADRISRVMSHGALTAHDVTQQRTIAIVVPKVAVQGLLQLPWVEESEVAENPAQLTDVPSAIRLRAETLPWGIDTIRADIANDSIGNKGTGISVAFLDSGVYCNHPDLSGRLVDGPGAGVWALRTDQSQPGEPSRARQRPSD